MFTGIVTEVGSVLRAFPSSGKILLTIDAPASAPQLQRGDSVAVQGVCLTAVECNGRTFAAEAVEETLSKSTLGSLAAGSPVNLELPLRLSDRLGGHMVLGHVDCVGTISAVEEREGSRMLRVKYPPQFARYVIPVGSVALDGISLTIASAAGDELTVSIIPHTLAMTTLARAAKGTPVNIEFDLIGKYVERLLKGEKGELPPPGGITREKLHAWGYGKEEDLDSKL